MNFLPDTNACINLLRQHNPKLIARWQAVRAKDIVLCSVVVYELRYGAERNIDPAREHAKLDTFLNAFGSLPFDGGCARVCARVRRELEKSGTAIGPHDFQIAAIAMQDGLTLVTHNTREFSRVAGLKLADWEI